MVHTYYCDYEPPKSAFHDFLDNLRGNRFTMCLKSVGSLYLFFTILTLIFFILGKFVFKISFGTSFILIFYATLFVSFPFSYFIYRIKIFEPVHQISVKWLLQKHVIAKPEQKIIDHEDITVIGNAESEKVINYLKILEDQATAIANGDFDGAVHNQKIEGGVGDAFSRMRNNLRLIQKQALSISEGNLSGDIFKTKVPGAVGEAFSTMIDNLTTFVNSLNDTASSMTKSAQDLSASSEEVTASTEEVSSTMTTLKNDSVSNVEKVKKNDTQDRLKSLEEKSHEIDKILDTITAVSEQTNLLALNAAIEAARAGDAGRGFAVVADEVRKLAEESNKSTKQISEMIGEIRSQIDDSVKAVETTMADLTDMTENNQKGFEGISSSVDEVASAMTTVAEKAETLSKNSDELIEMANRFKTK